MEGKKQELVGKVVSDVCDKTITIEVVTYKKHPLYKKNVKTTKRYAVHDEENKAKVGDIVKVVSSRPLSKTKRFVLDSIIEEAVIL
jgi:small subunit ribosomal protein S17